MATGAQMDGLGKRRLTEHALAMALGPHSPPSLSRPHSRSLEQDKELDGGERPSRAGLGPSKGGPARRLVLSLGLLSSEDVALDGCWVSQMGPFNLISGAKPPPGSKKPPPLMEGKQTYEGARSDMLYYVPTTTLHPSLPSEEQTQGSIDELGERGKT